MLAHSFIALTIAAVLCLANTSSGNILANRVKYHPSKLQNSAAEVGCMEAKGPLPQAINVWFMSPSNIPGGKRFEATMGRKGWVFGADMHYTATVRYAPHNDILISVSHTDKPNPSITDGLYYVQLQDKHSHDIRTFWISHFDKCRITLPNDVDLRVMEFGWVNQY